MTQLHLTRVIKITLPGFNRPTVSYQISKKIMQSAAFYLFEFRIVNIQVSCLKLRQDTISRWEHSGQFVKVFCFCLILKQVDVVLVVTVQISRTFLVRCWTLAFSNLIQVQFVKEFLFRVSSIEFMANSAHCCFFTFRFQFLPGTTNNYVLKRTRICYFFSNLVSLREIVKVIDRIFEIFQLFTLAHTKNL